MKYELINKTTNYLGKTLYRIKALKSFSNVTKGDLGGYVQSDKNLSQIGNCWIYGNAKVFGKAVISGNARIFSYE